MLTREDIEQIKNSPEGEGVRVTPIWHPHYNEVFRAVNVSEGFGDTVVSVNDKRGGVFGIFADQLELTVRR